MPALATEQPLEGLDQALQDDFNRKREEMQRVAKDCVVVVDNVPKIGAEKYPRLVSKLTPRFEAAGRLRRDGGDKPFLEFVQGEDGSSLGYAIAEYISPEEAHKAIALLHNFQLDRAHRFWACTAGDFERLQQMPDQFVPPQALPVTNRDRPNFKSYLLDERGREQFMIRHQDETSIYWHDHVVKPQLVSLCPIFFFFARKFAILPIALMISSFFPEAWIYSRYCIPTSRICRKL